MFTPEPMQAVALYLLTDDLPHAATALTACGMFNPEPVLNPELNEQPAEAFRQVFHSANNRLEKILAHAPVNFPEANLAVQPLISIEELTALNQQLGEVWQEFSALEELEHKLQDQYTTLSQLLETLQKFDRLDVDLSLLKTPKQFLNLHIGTIPLKNLEHFRQSIALAEHFLEIFHRTENTLYVVVAGTLNYEEQVQAILEYAEFRPLSIPTQFQHHPQLVHADLSAQAEQLRQDLNSLKQHQCELSAQHSEFLQTAQQQLQQASSYATLGETLRGHGQFCLIEGWIPRSEVAHLARLLNTALANPYVLTHRKPEFCEYAKVPSLLKHHPWLKIFSTLVQNYGIPRYGEFDPTLLFAVTFIVMFGAMFGDVGHGATLALVGWFARQKLQQVTPLFIVAGISSSLFGFLYGSIFGFENVLPALWLSPLHHPFLMLKLALYWGVGFILLATIITIVNRFQAREYLDAVFNHTGIAGIALYLGGFHAAATWLETHAFDSVQQLEFFTPLLLVLGYKWHENKLPLMERVLVTAIEGFEAVMSYLTNTLSFLRVAAFSLNHVALAIAVFTLADMMDAPASWLVIVLGNIFIIALESAIVTIQILRLEYYEGFSRFFSGNGRAFLPLRSGVK